MHAKDSSKSSAGTEQPMPVGVYEKMPCAEKGIHRNPNDDRLTPSRWSHTPRASYEAVQAGYSRRGRRVASAFTVLLDRTHDTIPTTATILCCTHKRHGSAVPHERNSPAELRARESSTAATRRRIYDEGASCALRQYHGRHWATRLQEFRPGLTSKRLRSLPLLSFP